MLHDFLPGMNVASGNFSANGATVYFLQHMLHNHQADLDIKGKTVAVSGFGNVSWGACVKATELGAKVVAISGPDGVIYNPNGIGNRLPRSR